MLDMMLNVLLNDWMIFFSSSFCDYEDSTNVHLSCDYQDSLVTTDILKKKKRLLINTVAFFSLQERSRPYQPK